MQDLICKYKRVKEILSGEINPRREWGIAILIFVVGAIVLGFLSFSLYRNIKPDEIIGSENGKVFVPEKINLINLDKIILNYEGISETFQTLKRIKLVDPSL